ncbi:MAG: single-stranded-DNA-specific exonuclease RecJ [Lachnospiraceae bacterium]|nr:single-stranded-DNA-specific exonuclease RecJ [Lachnospiraceae bacterium]
MSRWMIAAKRADFQDIAVRFGIDQVTARLLRNRGVLGDEMIRVWLSGGLSDLHDPHVLTDMDRAAKIIGESIRLGKRIRIIGDYDVDGICSTYILYRGLTAAGAEKLDYVLPDRVRDGYGLNENLIRQAAEDGVEVILTCDNGVRAIAEIALAKSLNMTVVVTDHHETKRDEEGREILPEADALVDPGREGDVSPFRAICGAVVAFKFLQVLFETDKPADEAALMNELVVFAAFATNCDVMPLVDENRVIMREGLRHLSDHANCGLDRLISACGLEASEVRAMDFGFTLGPCLNATGRLDSAHRAMDLLTCQDPERASVLAGDLLALNEERKALTAESVRRACELCEQEPHVHDRVLVLFLPECHESIAGIVAGRVRERYDKPAIILTDAAEPGLIKGSGRSIPQYDMYRGLSAWEHLFVRFGGHEQAAGLTLKKDDLEALRQGLNEACTLTDGDLTRVLHIDMEMPLSYATPELVKQFSVLEPFGKGNPEPLFAARDVRIVSGRIIGKNKNVGKYRIADAEGREYEMIWFGGLDRFHAFLTERFGADGLNDIYDGFRARGVYTFHMAYHAQINSWQGKERLQFQMEDFL